MGLNLRFWQFAGHMRGCSRFLFTLLLSLLFIGETMAQSGGYFLSHYRPQEDPLAQDNKDIVQDEKGRMNFASRRGVLSFDGKNWQLVRTSSSALSLAYNELSHKLFVGCRNDFGYIAANKAGVERFVSIAKIAGSDNTPLVGDVLQVGSKGSWVYFLSEHYLIEYSTISAEITNRWSTQEYALFSLFMHQGEFYVSTEEAKVFKPVGDQLEEVEMDWAETEESPIIFSASVNKKQSVIGCMDSRLYLIDQEVVTPLELKDQSYLEKAVLLNAQPLHDSLLFIATLRGGVMAVNWKSGETESFINYNSGLPDNEVHAIGLDKDKGVWISHSYGFSRIDPALPLKSYSSYPGLEGNILSVSKLGDSLYVGTSTGLFLLEKVENYQLVKKIVKEQLGERPASKESSNFVGPPVSINSADQPKSSTEKVLENEEVAQQEDLDEKPRKKRGWLARLFSKKKKKAEAEEQEEVAEATEEEAAEESVLGVTSVPITPSRLPAKNKGRSESETRKVSKTIYELQSSYWAFRQIKGIQGKCNKLIPLNDGSLLLGSNAGLFQIRGTEAQLLLKSPIRTLYFSRRLSRLYASSYDNRIYDFLKDGDAWIKEEHFSEVEIYCSSIHEDVAGTLWFAGSNFLYQMKIEEDGTPIDFEPIELENPYNDEVRLLRHKERLYFYMSSGFYYYSTDQGLVRDSLLSHTSSAAHQSLHSQDGWVWFKGNNHWSSLGSYPVSQSTHDYLHLLHQPSGLFAFVDQQELWVSTRGNQLYRLPLENNDRYYTPYNAYLKAVHYEGKSFLPQARFQIEQNKNGIRFEFAMPDYLDYDRVEFRYKLIGLDMEWSEWMGESQIAYSTLPSGRYKLMAQARSATDKLSDIPPVVFYVKPPYWEQTWFYGLEILFFGTLLLLSFRLNRTKMRNKAISKVLTFFTLILLVEFLQVTIEGRVTIEKTPVTNFLVQAGIALSLFPLERLLSYLILRERISFLTKERKDGTKDS